MILALSGASGFIGTNVRRRFEPIASEILTLRRNDPESKWKEIISKSDVIINLAGSSVFKRWTRKNRKIILESRLITTRRIVTILNELPENIPHKLLISASATGIYPDDKFNQYDEYNLTEGSGFLAEVVSKWEAEADGLINPSVRIIVTRFGIILGKNGGVLSMIVPIFKLGLGGIVGTGKQITPFIHIDDLLDAFLFFIKNEKTSGLYNLVTPNPISNKDFTKILAEKLHRPAVLRIPVFALRLIYGKASCIMLNGAHVLPKHLITQGFSFKYPTFEKAIDKILE
jgi:uncharacterized protein